ncbi:Ubiquitin-protein ligase E3B [Caenorhabditis elegans]|uniref:Ubiquitin-protein ligase E3B n=1 Tax=Caenorhabditis elegans TaxID=6239 RepID=Q9XXE6_CAEEL|nr:HECT-type E3 ubiquitin transferase [Caenorhabditis elegans]CAA19508.1 HECT-type E3 ubiquitin transferase [Caenorhabditis elegans]|eukprot:NP_499392.1 OXidative stress Induced [Caenorhabditis elegans]
MDNILRTLQKNAREREEEETQRRRIELAHKLEPYLIGYLTRKKFHGKIKTFRPTFFNDFNDLEKSNKTLLPVAQMLVKVPRVIENSRENKDIQMLCNICRHLIISIDSPSKEISFVAAFLNKDTIKEATSLITSIFSQIPQILCSINGERAAELKQWQCLIHFVIVFSSSSNWLLVRNAPQVQTVLNGLCVKMMSLFYEPKGYEQMATSLFVSVNGHKPLINVETVNAQFSILCKPLKTENPELFSIFVLKVLTCPALLVHLNAQHVELLKTTKIFEKTLHWLRANAEEIETGMDVRLLINLLANLVHFAYINDKTLESKLYEWTWAVGVSLSRCTELTVKHGGTKTSLHYWHPVFGHYLLPIDKRTEGALRNVLFQLKMLWSSRVVRCLFGNIMENTKTASFSVTDGQKNSKDISAAFSKLWRKLGGSTDSASSSSKSESEPPPTLIAIVCQVYMTALNTMVHMKGEIISGLCRDDQLLKQLWTYLREWGEKAGGTSGSIFNSSNAEQWGPVSASLQSLKRPSSPHTATLRLFVDCAAAIISILDEEEIFEKETPFSNKELESICKYVNIFCFRSIWSGAVDETSANTTGLFHSMHSLLTVLYERDSRRSFAANDSKFWLISEVKPSSLTIEYEKKSGKGVLMMRKMAHLVPIKDRMLLFRRQVQDDKNRVATSLNDPQMQTWITVQRNRIIEDGFNHLSKLTIPALKSTIRVKFVNEQGLDEAGIDQDGVFKEFLELTLKKVFDPQLNLFSTTSTGVLYPSPTSSLHDDHLALFTFVGRMLGKAVYEGIVVDVQLAPVLLAAVLGSHRLCAFDELSQLDPELYRSLTFVKRYEGEMADLSLTFSVDEDFMGKISTVDLVPSGRTISVTNENKIDYVHRMAHHRVFRRTQEQCKAFVTGMQSILQPTWLSLFAPNDLQCLISGVNSDIDLADLKRNVQYFGGFHGNHRLIKWLWDILENKFTSEERKLFLKFVTSCSRPPVLGFSYLEPPFSIRCVEVSDDQDQGDTLGSVVRGFLALRKGTAATRLPTASTCFNLLKLPNYNKKSLLLEKLRYAIHAGTGFELS